MKEIKISYRIIILLLIVGIYLIYNSFPCIMINLSGIPQKIKVNLDKGMNKIIFVYGAGICGTCPQGSFIYSLKESKDVLFVLPGEINDNELENFKNSFSIHGKIIKGDSEITRYLGRIFECSNRGDWRKNLYIEYDKKQNMKVIKPF